MISGKEVLNVLGALVPMYFPMVIAYITVRWFKLFTVEQSAGISRFLKMVAIPFLVFHVISNNNLLHINLKLFAADSLQKLISLAVLFLWKLFYKNAPFEWVITLFSLSSLPSTLIIGIPMVRAMYGEGSIGYMIQTLVFQNAIWVNVLIVLFEYRAATVIIAERLKSSVTPDQRPAGGECIDSNGQIDTIGNSNHDNGGISSKEIGPAVEGDGGRGFEFILEAENEEDHLSEDSSSSKANGMTKLVLYMLTKKIITNPITYASLFGILWSLISFKCDIKMPTMMDNCVLMLANTGQALSMFSLGIFMAAQPSIISCSLFETTSAMVVRFLVSPILIALVSKLIGLKGLVLHTAIIQAAFPQGVMSFVLAKEYNVHPNVLSTSVAFGMLIAFPIILTYYLLMGAIFK